MSEIEAPIATFYFWDPETMLYTHAVAMAFEAPPENATELPPPEGPYVRGRWEGEVWSETADYRGVWAYDAEGQGRRITELGPLPEGWSLDPPAPPPPDPDLELKSQLSVLDWRSIRALRAIAAGSDTQDDRDKIAELESQAAGLRAQLVNPEALL